jgi:hypothetical protein
MAKQKTYRIEQHPAAEPVSKLDTLRDTWTVMKPFVHFSIKALKVIAHALIFVVKHIPKPGEYNTTGKKNNKVIKI